jgi:hypothetical protein
MLDYFLLLNFSWTVLTRIQQLSDVLERTEVNLIENEINETIAGIDESAIDALDETITELEEDLIKAEQSGLNTGATEVSDISLNLPEGADFSSLDPTSYTVNIVGLSSKTGSRNTNLEISRKRAESAKATLMAQYGIPETTFHLSEDRQGDHPDNANDNLADWQGVKVEIQPNDPTTFYAHLNGGGNENMGN